MFPSSGAKKDVSNSTESHIALDSEVSAEHQGTGETLTLHVSHGVTTLSGLDVQTSMAAWQSSIRREERNANMKTHQ